MMSFPFTDCNDAISMLTIASYESPTTKTLHEIFIASLQINLFIDKVLALRNGNKDPQTIVQQQLILPVRHFQQVVRRVDLHTGVNRDVFYTFDWTAKWFLLFLLLLLFSIELLPELFSVTTPSSLNYTHWENEMFRVTETQVCNKLQTPGLHGVTPRVFATM